MSLTQQVQKDMVDAMRKKEELRLSTLRMMKAALKNKEIDKRAPLDEKEELQVFSTMIKQRKDSIERSRRAIVTSWRRKKPTRSSSSRPTCPRRSAKRRLSPP